MSSGPVVLVSGSRRFDLRFCLFALLARLAPSHILVGDCPFGADRLAALWARNLSCPSLRVRLSVFAASWSQWGRYAGPRRNSELVAAAVAARAAGASVVCVFCWPPSGPSRGTADCFRRAVSTGLPVVELGVRPSCLRGLGETASLFA